MMDSLLESGKKIKIKDMMNMQADIHDSYLEKDLPLWLGLVNKVLL